MHCFFVHSMCYVHDAYNLVENNVVKYKASLENAFGDIPYCVWGIATVILDFRKLCWREKVLQTNTNFLKYDFFYS